MPSSGILSNLATLFEVHRRCLAFLNLTGGYLDQSAYTSRAAEGDVTAFVVQVVVLK